MAFASPALAGTQSSELAAEFGLNQSSPGQMQKQLLGSRIIRGSLHSVELKYQFSNKGGAIGAVTLVNSRTGQPEVLPQNAIIRNCVIDVVTAPVGASATLAFGTGQSTTDLLAATAITSLGVGLHACVPVGSASTSVKLTADSTPVMTIATTALTAGEIHVFVDYNISL